MHEDSTGEYFVTICNLLGAYEETTTHTATLGSTFRLATNDAMRHH